MREPRFAIEARRAPRIVCNASGSSLIASQVLRDFVMREVWSQLAECEIGRVYQTTGLSKAAGCLRPRHRARSQTARTTSGQLQGCAKRPFPLHLSVMTSSANGNALVQIRDVHKYFTRGNERINVLQGVNLDIPQGDFLALMGPSGSGKTTLLNLMGGLDAPSTGMVDVGGVEVSGLKGSGLSRWRSENIGFVFQLYNLLPKLTALKNVELPLLLTRLSKSERRERAAIALKVVGLAERTSHYPRQLSGGQEQRVGIARAIVTDPALLLCDEPTGDLDRKAGDEILDLLQALNRDHGKTIVMVTHDPHAADRARRTLHLEKGVLS